MFRSSRCCRRASHGCYSAATTLPLTYVSVHLWGFRHLHTVHHPLQVPRASAMVAEAIAQAISDGVLPTTFFSDLPADVTATFKRDGAADFARRLFSLYVAHSCRASCIAAR